MIDSKETQTEIKVKKRIAGYINRRATDSQALQKSYKLEIHVLKLTMKRETVEHVKGNPNK